MCALAVAYTDYENTVARGTGFHRVWTPLGFKAKGHFHEGFRVIVVEATVAAGVGVSRGPTITAGISRAVLTETMLGRVLLVGHG